MVVSLSMGVPLSFPTIRESFNHGNSTYSNLWKFSTTKDSCYTLEHHNSACEQWCPSVLCHNCSSVHVYGVGNSPESRAMVYTRIGNKYAKSKAVYRVQVWQHPQDEQLYNNNYSSSMHKPAYMERVTAQSWKVPWDSFMFLCFRCCVSQ